MVEDVIEIVSSEDQNLRPQARSCDQIAPAVMARPPAALDWGPGAPSAESVSKVDVTTEEMRSCSASPVALLLPDSVGPTGGIQDHLGIDRRLGIPKHRGLPMDDQLQLAGGRQRSYPVPALMPC